MSLPEQIYLRRLREFDAIIEHYHKNPVVNKFIQMYATGELATKEEALFQMVKHLCTDWDEVNRRSYEMLSRISIVQPKED